MAVVIYFTNVVLAAIIDAIVAAKKYKKVHPGRHRDNQERQVIVYNESDAYSRQR